MCSSFTPCYFAIIHTKYYIKMYPLAPLTFLGMLPVFYEAVATDVGMATVYVDIIRRVVLSLCFF